MTRVIRWLEKLSHSAFAIPLSAFDGMRPFLWIADPVAWLLFG